MGSSKELKFKYNIKSFVLKIIKKIKKNLSLEYLYKNLNKGCDLGLRLNGRYFISTNLGVFAIENKTARLLTNSPGYGLVIDKDSVFFTIDSAASSSVCHIKKTDFLSKSWKHIKSKCDVVYKIACKSSNERIHQLTLCDDGRILFANTGRNSLVLLETGSGSVSEITPFSDSFGQPIFGDHNHINSAIQYDGSIFFVAYKANVKSLIGYICDDVAYGFFYKNQGVHDIYKTPTGFIFLDTFGDGKGNIVTEQGMLYSNYFNQGNGFVLRGAAGCGNEWLIGHSHKGPRSKRYDGRGGVIRILEGRCEYMELPAAQIYQILNEDGTYFDCSQNTISLSKQLEAYFGPASNLGHVIKIN